MKEQEIARSPEGAQEHLGRIEFSNSLLGLICMPIQVFNEAELLGVRRFSKLAAHKS